MPRKKFNLEVPAEFVEVIDQLAEKYDGKWLAYSAGMLLLIEAPESVQRDAMRRVQDAKWDGDDYAALVAAALKRRANGGVPEVDADWAVEETKNGGGSPAKPASPPSAPSGRASKAAHRRGPAARRHP